MDFVSRCEGLGWLEEALAEIAGIMRDDRPHPDKRAVVIMGADNGVVKEGVTQTDQSVTMQVLENMGNDLSTACVMSHQAGCDMIPVNIERTDGWCTSKDPKPGGALWYRKHCKRTGHDKRRVCESNSYGN